MESMELWEFCNKYLLDEKIFIVPSRSIGLQMINRLSLEGHRALNLRPIGLERLAFEICQEFILKEDILVIDNILGSSLIIQILKDLYRKDPENFFFKEGLIDIRTGEEVYKVIRELKHSGIEDFPKEKNLDIIYQEYQKTLSDLNAMDYYDVIVKAGQLDEIKIYQEIKIGLAYNIEFESAERILLEKLTQKNATKIIMPVKSLNNKPKNYYFKDHINIENQENKSINFYEAYGSKNEINYIINDILSRGIKMDDLVIAYTHSSYADLINIEFEKEAIPIGFGQGLGIESSSTYRFIEALFSWAENYYSIKELRPIFINRDVKIGLESEIKGKVSPLSIYEELVRSKLVFGRENYRRILDPEGEELRELNQYSRGRRLWLSEFFNDLFMAIPQENNFKLDQYIPKLTRIINKYVRNLNKYDGAAKTEVLGVLASLESLDMEIGKSEYFNIILSYIKKKRILRAQPQPGHVFATSFNDAGYTGRKNLYLIGLDSDSLSNKVMESPILLDSMRKEISNNLSFAKESYRYKKYKIRELLTGNFDNISIGYSNFDTIDVKNKGPSQIYTELKDLYRHVDPVKTEASIILGRDLVKSGTGLEVLATCSRKAYLRYKLNLKPLDDVEVRVDRWLDGLNRGKVVHEILNEYFQLEEEERRNEKLRQICEDICEKTLEDIPYAVEEIYIREKEEIFQICYNIVERERQDQEWDVLVCELAFGLDENKDNKEFGKLDKQTIQIGDIELDVIGSIDRIDVNKNRPNLLRIVDYKTGSKVNFEKGLYKKTGRGKNQELDYSETNKFQAYIYAKAFENILKAREDGYKDAEISNFLYIFQGDDDKSLINIGLDKKYEEVIEERIRYLLDLDIIKEDKNVIYDPDDFLRCKYCDYGAICMTDQIKNDNLGEGEAYD